MDSDGDRLGAMYDLPEVAHGWIAPAFFSAEEERVQGALLWRMLCGCPITPSELAAMVGLAEAELEPVVAELQTKQCLRRDERGAIVAARGLMLEPSAHRLVTKYGSVHTQCSVDAIGIPAALGIEATIEDRCALCNKPISAHILGRQVISMSPVDAVVVMAEACSAREGDIPTMCHETNLFCSSLHAQQWQAQQGTLRSVAVSPTDAVRVGCAIWGRFAPYA